MSNLKNGAGEGPARTEEEELTLTNPASVRWCLWLQDRKRRAVISVSLPPSKLMKDKENISEELDRA